MSQKETIERAYGSIPREATPMFDFDWMPSTRGVKYFWYKMLRYFTR